MQSPQLRTVIQRRYRGHTEATRRRHSMFAVCSIQKRSRLESLEFSSSTYKRRAFFMRSFPKHKSHDAKFTLWVQLADYVRKSCSLLESGAGRSWNPANSCIQIWRIGSSTEFENLNSPLPAPEQATDERFYQTVNWLLKERLFIRYRTVCTEVRTVREPLSVEFKVKPIWIGAFE